MSKQTVLLTYEFTVDSGEINSHALAEWLKLADEHSATFTVWELAGSDDIKLIRVEPKKD